MLLQAQRTALDSVCAVSAFYTCLLPLLVSQCAVIVCSPDFLLYVSVPEVAKRCRQQRLPLAAYRQYGALKFLQKQKALALLSCA
jgi:hypothetical protein